MCRGRRGLRERISYFRADRRGHVFLIAGIRYPRTAAQMAARPTMVHTTRQQLVGRPRKAWMMNQPNRTNTYGHHGTSVRSNTTRGGWGASAIGTSVTSAVCMGPHFLSAVPQGRPRYVKPNRTGVSGRVLHLKALRAFRYPYRVLLFAHTQIQYTIFTTCSLRVNLKITSGRVGLEGVVYPGRILG